MCSSGRQRADAGLFSRRGPAASVTGFIAKGIFAREAKRSAGSCTGCSHDAAYAEIGVTTNFSFLRGASHPQEYVHQAGELRLPAIGIADRNTLAGVVRAYSELENDELPYKPKLLIGSRLVFIDGTPDILVYPVIAPPMAGCVGC